MRVVVTGAQGQVGSELILQGRGLGLQMIAAGRGELDITRQDAVIAYFRSKSPDVVINAAAYTAVDKAEEECRLAYAINRDGPVNPVSKELSRNKLPISRSNVVRIQGAARGA